jgi:hypothetical protein
MRVKTLTNSSDAPRPGIGWLVEPARDRIISGARMGREGLGLLKTVGCWPESQKQLKEGVAEIRKLLWIGAGDPRPSVLTVPYPSFPVNMANSLRITCFVG